MKHVVHVIVGLGVGGAESMLVKLLGSLDRQEFRHSVVTLMDGGDLRPEVVALGVPVHSLGLVRGLLTPAGLWRLRRLAHVLGPDLVQGWMYHGNLAGWLLAKWTPGPRPDLIWNIRHSLYDLAHESAQTRLLLRLSAALSGRPRVTVFNATASIAQHAARGFDTSRAVMVPNGFDLAAFAPDPTASAALRQELGLEAGAVLVGAVGRYHPIKGHADLLRAAATVLAEHTNVHLLLAGLGLERPTGELASLVDGLPDRSRVHWLGHRSPMPRFMAGLDLLVLPSLSEGFPNVVGEAMACGVPCVVTRVGEAPELVGRCGRVVAPARPEALAAAMSELVAMAPDERATLGRAARERIQAGYGLPAVAQRFSQIYRG